uniref:Fatty acid desaturase domain-containing protein n=2 Tax=Coccolithus braarudii TaxID=221442 RepID=A0A7S0LS07_9EUKA|mmetsp:Transcript_7450/g.16322  ORF Transcript_7450/g.16322 Transcript_7450/m.16322 type:complete len:384 (+) Transcript_7450:99-1250(+)
MGKGGSSDMKPVRTSLSATIPQPSKEITKRSVRDSIPAHLFERRYTTSFFHLGLDLLTCVVSVVVLQAVLPQLHAVCVPFAWLAYWMYQGINFTALWVLAHECGHGGFTNSRVVNDIVGWVLHSGLLTPYFSWALTHAKHHHYTNHMTEGETWVPSSASPDKPAVKFAKTPYGTAQRILAVFLVGWYMYLLKNETGARQNKGQSHFSPSSKALFKPKDKPFVLASNAGMLIMLAVLAAVVSKQGFLTVFLVYGMPQVICNFYLCSITYMQHTHADVPHFEGEDWTWLRGALSTIDRSMGPWVDSKLHHICDSHVVHHLFSEMPFYGAKAATPYVKAHLGVYYKSCLESRWAGSEYLGYWRDFYQNMRTAVVVGKGEDGFMWFR